MGKENDTSVYFDRSKLKFVGLESAHLKQLKDAYKSLDVDAELKKMELWLVSPKGKRRAGNIGFILNWLNNASPSAPSTSEQLDFYTQNSPLQPLLLDYLRDLWKSREHILEFNKTRKKH